MAADRDTLVLIRGPNQITTPKAGGELGFFEEEIVKVLDDEQHKAGLYRFDFADGADLKVLSICITLIPYPGFPNV